MYTTVKRNTTRTHGLTISTEPTKKNNMRPITFVKITLVLGVLVSAITMSAPLFLACVAGAVVLAVLWLHKTKNAQQKVEPSQTAQTAQPVQTAQTAQPDPAQSTAPAQSTETAQPARLVQHTEKKASADVRTGSFPLPENAHPSDYETLESKTARMMSARNKFLGLRGRIGDRYVSFKRYGTALPLSRGMRNVRLSSSVSQ